MRDLWFTTSSKARTSEWLFKSDRLVFFPIRSYLSIGKEFVPSTPEKSITKKLAQRRERLLAAYRSNQFHLKSFVLPTTREVRENKFRLRLQLALLRLEFCSFCFKRRVQETFCAFAVLSAKANGDTEDRCLAITRKRTNTKNRSTS